jgi:acyl-CoA hydrolase
VAELARLDGDWSLLFGFMPDPAPAWLADLPVGAGVTMLGGYALADALARGQVDLLPVRLSAMPKLLATELRPDVTVVVGIRRGNALAFRANPGWGHAAARHARAVVVELDEQAPDLGAPEIPGTVVAVVPGARPLVAPGPITPTAADVTIGEHVASLVPAGATVQHGPGGIGDAVMRALREPVHFLSGLAGDSLVALDARGLLDGPAEAAYLWGGDALVAMAVDGRLRLVPVERTHDIGRLAQIPRFVACNTALQVGLDGSVNVERVGSRVVAGIGGHADFSIAASQSPGGRSIVALRAARGERSTIVPHLDVVSTPRCDVDFVVTEHGIADLRGRTDAARAEALIAVAAPEHRDALADLTEREGTQPSPGSLR